MKKFFSKESVLSEQEKTKKDNKLWQNFLITYHVFNNLLLFFIIVFSFLLFGGIGIGAGYFAAVVRDDPIRSSDELRSSLMNYEQTSEIFFAGEVYLGKLNTDLELEETTIDKISPLIKTALISTEDEHFWEHNGVVPKSIFRAVFQETTNSAVQSGGSTITQQLAKMRVLSNDASFERKFKEILLAQRIENLLSKEEILEAYLNVSPFGRNASGHNIAGIQTAAKGIFGVDSDQVSLPQAAFLAGLPNSPSYLTPFQQSGKLKEDLSPGINRMKLVLKRMYTKGHITKEEYDEALNYDIAKDFQNAILSENDEKKYPYIIAETEKRVKNIIKPILAAKQGYSEEDLKNNTDLSAEFDVITTNALRENNYNIFTTIDKEIYESMEETVKKFPHFQAPHTVKRKNEETGVYEKVNEPVETGAILIDNKSGRIISFVGGRDFNREQINHATATLRSNGSTMKPLLVYGPAMEYGVSSPGKPLINAKIAIPQGGNSKPYKPQNYGDQSYTGISSTRDAVKNSYNVPAILQYSEIINRVPANYLVKMGFTTLSDEDFVNLSAGIGGVYKGVTVEENTNAYTTFANDGNFVDAYLIEKILDDKGEVIYQHEVQEERVFSPQTAYLMREVLRDVVQSGTAAALKGKMTFTSDWVGKTGTSQDYKDAWLVLSNPTVTFGTWMGYDTQDSLQKGGMSYSMRNLTLWSNLINEAYNVKPDVFNATPAFSTKEEIGNLVMASFDKIMGTAPSSETLASGRVQTDVFNQDFLPAKAGTYHLEPYVVIKGKKYATLPETPEVFVRSQETVPIDSLNAMGFKYVIDKEEFARLTGLTLNYSDKESASGAISTHANPQALPEKINNLTVANNEIRWSASNSNNVVGYYVYWIQGDRGVLQHALKEADELVYAASMPGSYVICAVSISGTLSEPSEPIYIQ